MVGSAPEIMDTMERQVARNTPRLILYFVAAGLLGTIGLRSTSKSGSPWVIAWIRPGLAWVRGFAWIWVILLVVVLGCALMSLALHRLFGETAPKTAYRVLGAVVALAVVAFVLFIPMCFGSLHDSTYECVTLFQRAADFIRGG